MINIEKLNRKSASLHLPFLRRPSPAPYFHPCFTMSWFALSNFSQKIWRWLGTLVYLHFVSFVICLNVMALQFCKWYLSNIVVLSLLSLLCKNGNLTIENYIRKYGCFNEGWLFVDKFKVAGLPRMINKLVLAQFIHKPSYLINWKIIYHEKIGDWVKAKILLSNS